jgi:hypothetical protein
MNPDENIGCLQIYITSDTWFTNQYHLFTDPGDTNHVRPALGQLYSTGSTYWNLVRPALEDVTNKQSQFSILSEGICSLLTDCFLSSESSNFVIHIFLPFNLVYDKNQCQYNSHLSFQNMSNQN